MLSKISTHPLLLQYSKFKPETEINNKVILERLVEELIVMNDDIKIRYLFHKLEKTKTRISDIKSFWKQCNLVVDNNSKLLFIIMSHPLLFKSSDYRDAGESDHSTILERFV
eukprot:485126_1